MVILDFRGMFSADSKAITASAVGTPRTKPGDSWKAIIEPIEPFLQSVSHRLTKQVTSFEPDLVPYAEYALNGNGKNLRPALVALSANALDKVGDIGHGQLSVKVHVAHGDNVPTGPGIAKVEACGVGASSVVAHDLTPNDRQLPDRDAAVVVLEDKILARSKRIKA